VRVVEIAAALIVVFMVQTLGGRYFWPLQTYLDLFLVSAVAFGVVRGRTIGMLSGTVGGLIQDAFSGGLLGLNGLSKTTVGYLAGIISRWLIVRGWAARFLFFFLASAVDLLILAMVGLAIERPAVIDDGVSALILCAGNGLVGTIVLGLVDRNQKPS
jgi:rod shape-determining protein MreD